MTSYRFLVLSKFCNGSVVFTTFCAAKDLFSAVSEQMSMGREVLEVDFA